jgi:hypothetical protein
MKCVTCHNYVVHKKNPEGKHSPRMADCFRCHNGKKATDECNACHKKKSLPKNHRAAEWLVVHSEKKKEIDCAKCHGWVKDYCKDCHKRRPAAHAGQWRKLHAVKAAVNRNCSTCHKVEFCVKCHGENP